MFSLDKRYWPEFGIVTIFFVNKKYWPTLMLLQGLYRGALSYPARSIFATSDRCCGTYFLLFRLFSRYRSLAQTTVGGVYQLV